VAEGLDGGQVLELVSRTNPELLLIDLSTLSNGHATLRQLKEADHATRAVIMAEKISREESLETLRLGAHGVLLKTAAVELLFRCIRAVMQGQCWVDRQTAGDVVSTLKIRERLDPRSGDAGAKLSLAEDRLLGVLQCGSSNKSIARQLGIAEQTVKNHLSRLYERFDVTNRLELVLKLRPNR
jgi:DNA-binding NarL/FixJ family response regulator